MKTASPARHKDLPDCLDSAQLARLEQSFRRWAAQSPRPDIRTSRMRILIIFLLIRYTGGKLNEVLTLDADHDIDHATSTITFRGSRSSSATRSFPVAATLGQEIRAALASAEMKGLAGRIFDIDPAFVRKKFYEQAEACGLPKHSGSPEMIRKARGAELMQDNMPLSAVQHLMGHSTPSLTSSYISFSEDDVRRITHYYVDREASRKTSARNCFFGKILNLVRGDIQSYIEISTLDGYRVKTVITNDSVGRLGLRKGMLVTAEVKAPWVILQKSDNDPGCSAENQYAGRVERITKGRINTEYVVRISEHSELCSIITTESSRLLDLKRGDPVQVLFNSFAVVLHVG